MKRRWYELEACFPDSSTRRTVRVDGLLVVTSRDRHHDPITAARTEANHDRIVAACAATNAGPEVRLDVAVALGSFVPVAGLSRQHSERVSLAFGIALAIVAPIELLGIGPLLEANHPLRVAMPAILGALAYSEMYASGLSWPRLSRGYVMALLTFALAGVDVAALFFRALGGAWIVPGFTVLVSALICVTALIPKGRVSWLLS